MQKKRKKKQLNRRGRRQTTLEITFFGHSSLVNQSRFPACLRKEKEIIYCKVHLSTMLSKREKVSHTFFLPFSSSIFFASPLPWVVAVAAAVRMFNVCKKEEERGSTKKLLRLFDNS